ncbi:Zn(2)-C6 fungal-type domain-containing protein [Fusarium keratoplasticum]|nr:Zn(2)-C6 fungal-type domain-containing protein [Fusarium keratoplasticum]
MEPLLANILSLDSSGILPGTGMPPSSKRTWIPSQAASLPVPAMLPVPQQHSQPGSADAPVSREAASYARRRAGTACTVCRSRKTKCDNQRPICGFCKATGGACVYPEDAPSDPSKLDRGSLAILQRLGEMEQRLTTLLDRQNHVSSPNQDPTRSCTAEHTESPTVTPGWDAGVDTPGRVEETSYDRPPSGDIVTRSSEMRVEKILQWLIFSVNHPSLASSLGRVDTIPRVVGSESLFDLDPEVIRNLVENFLVTNHVKNPIFNINELWVSVRNVAETGLRWDGETCLVLLICAISVLSSKVGEELHPGYSKHPSRLNRAELYFQMAQRRIGMLYHSNCLMAAQCSFLTAVYLMTTFRIMAAWKAFSQAGSQCVGLLVAGGSLDEEGRAKSPEIEGMSVNDQQMEESLYWSCLKSELELRTELGLPGSILNDMQYSHLYPSPPGPSQLVADRMGPESEHLEKGWFFYLAEIALRRIMNEALSARYRVGSWYYTTSWWATSGVDGFRGHVDEFRVKLNTWQEMLPPVMRFPHDPLENTGDALRGILRGHFIDILDVLYFPAVQAVVCKDVSELNPYVLATAQAALQTATYRIAICEEGFWHRHQGTWLMIRTCSRSALLLLATALRAQQMSGLEDLLPNINPLIYGGFTEHMGRCIYGGIYEPNNGHGLSGKNGLRTDVMECIKELQVPVVRYPGGNFCATYRWQDGIGPKDKRPKRPELAWEGAEPNTFGTDEFMTWCKEVGAEPYLCLNMGTGTLEDALAWVEYCNSDKDTYFANLRRQNGHDEPYRVKYWALGNEMWGPWQVEQHTKEDYAKKAVQWARALKLLDPSIQLILCGKDGYSDWDRYTLQQCVRWVDMHSIHYYSMGKGHYTNISSVYGAERAIQVCSSLIDLARCEFDMSPYPEVDRINSKPLAKKRPTICFDEWNVWDPERAPGNKGAEEQYTLSDGLAVAIWLNVFIRNCKELGMATIAQSVNVIAPLMTTPQGVWKQTTYFPLLLFSRYMRGKSVAVHVRSGTYEGPTWPEWIQSTCVVPKLDASAAVDYDGWMNVAVVNSHEEQTLSTKIDGIKAGTEVQVFTVGGERYRASDVNSTDDERIGICETTWTSGESFKFERLSFTLLRWKL